MNETLWTLPVPSSSLDEGGPAFSKRAGREVALRLAYEGDDEAGTPRVTTLRFLDVEAFRCTYGSACDDGALAAYDRLVDRGATPWLAEVQKALAGHGKDTAGLRHLMITFDDGPSYEVLCRRVVVDEA